MAASSGLAFPVSSSATSRLNSISVRRAKSSWTNTPSSSPTRIPSSAQLERCLTVARHSEANNSLSPGKFAEAFLRPYPVFMSVDLERSLRAYAELLIRIGLDLQPGQRLLITEPYDNQGVSLESAPLVRVITEVAYKHGARFVDVIWADSALHGIRQVHAPRDSFAEFSDWKAKAIHMAAERGDALLFLLSSEPGSQDPKAAHNAQVVRRTAWQHFGPTAELLTRGSTNWCAAPVASTPL